MLKNLYASLVFSTLLCISVNAFADATAPVVKRELPIECTDRENYDQMDCHRALDLIQWTKDQEKVPDNQRTLVAGLGEDVLVEKETGYRIGPHKFSGGGSKGDGVAIKVGAPGRTQMFLVSGVCSIGNSINVLKNTPDFTFFYAECDSLDNRKNQRDDRRDYYVFDKHYNRLDLLLPYSEIEQATRPKLTFSKAIYQFYWEDHMAERTKQTIYFDFKITGKNPGNLKCIRSWNDDCDIAPQTLLVPGTYKVLDE